MYDRHSTVSSRRALPPATYWCAPTLSEYNDWIFLDIHPRQVPDCDHDCDNENVYVNENVNGAKMLCMRSA